MTKPWSFVLPVKDEIDLLKRTLPAAIALKPDEIVLVTDYTYYGNEVASHADIIAERMRYGGMKYVEVDTNPDWQFHQAWARRKGYLEATHDVIFTSDVDNIVLPAILRGLELIGKDHIALVSFSKILRVNSPMSFIRYVAYNIRRKTALNVFTGLYWLDRPSYLELAPEEEIRKIRNGEDNFIVQKIQNQTHYRMLTLRDLGARCLTGQNEDMPWRQFYEGLWIARTARLKYDRILHRGMSKNVLILRGLFAYDGFLARTLMYNRPFVLKGVLWGWDRLDLLEALPADYNELVYRGRKLLTPIDSPASPSLANDLYQDHPPNP